jgi:chemosensory pili system protein ChpC
VSAEEEELYSLLVPLVDERLIVPRACVAEVVRYTTPAQKETDSPWILGSISWNGRELPVVAFEGAIGRDVPPPTGRTRVVVFHSITGNLRSGFFGMLTQGFPQLVRVNEEVLKLQSKDEWSADAPVLCRVKMINEFPLIPDLEALEGALAEQTL